MTNCFYEEHRSARNEPGRSSWELPWEISASENATLRMSDNSRSFASLRMTARASTGVQFPRHRPGSLGTERSLPRTGFVQFAKFVQFVFPNGFSLFYQRFFRVVSGRFGVSAMPRPDAEERDPPRRGISLRAAHRTKPGIRRLGVAPSP